MNSNWGRGRFGLVSGSRGTLLVSVAIGWFFALGLRFVLQGILPTIAASFPAATQTQAGIAVTVLWATYGIVQFPAGIAADRIGEGRVLIGSLLASAVSVLVFSLTPTFTLFVIAMGVFGAATGFYSPPRGTLLTRVFSGQADRALGLTLAAGSFGAAVLPALAAVFVDGLGWRTTLGLAAPGFLLAALFVYRSSRGLETRDDDSDQTETEPKPESEQLSLLTTIKSAARAVCCRRTSLAVLAAIVMYFGFQGFTALATTYLVAEKGFTQSSAGILYGGLFVVGALSQWFSGVLAQRARPVRVLVVVAGVSVLPLVGLVVFENRLLVAASMLLNGIRMGFAPVSNAFIIDLLPADVEGTTWGAIRTSLFVVSSLASTMVGVLADAGQFDGALLLLAGLTGAAAALYVTLLST